MNKVNILGVGIDDLSLPEVLKKIEEFLKSDNQFFIVTPNPEFIVAAQKDEKFAEILNYADIAVADGVGLLYAARYLGQKLKRVTGVDLVWHISDLANKQGNSIYLLGGELTIAALAASKLKKAFPDLKIAGAADGGVVTPDGQADQKIIDQINEAAPEVIFVAFGQIKQEKWIFNNLDKLKTVKVAIGVGGSFDYIAGTIHRAPEIFRRLGLEWLYRLFNQPSIRWKRIFTAVIIFPLLVFWSGLTSIIKK